MLKLTHTDWIATLIRFLVLWETVSPALWQCPPWWWQADELDTLSVLTLRLCWLWDCEAVRLWGCEVSMKTDSAATAAVPLLHWSTASVKQMRPASSPGQVFSPTMGWAGQELLFGKVSACKVCPQCWQLLGAAASWSRCLQTQTRLH